MKSFWKYLISCDEGIILLIQRVRSAPLTGLLKVLTYSGTGKSWWFMVITLNIFNYSGINFIDQQQLFLRAFYSPLLAWIMGSIIKKLVARERPSEKILGFKRIIASPSCDSFPSTHAASTFSFFISLQLGNFAIAPLIGLWAGLVSFSRIYLGVHYLSDIIGGVILGLICSFIINLI